MALDNSSPIIRRSESLLATHTVLRNTYALLSMTLLFSAAMALVSMQLNLPRGTSMITMFAAMGLLFFVLPKVQDSMAGVWVTFLFTGLLGFGLGPMLGYYAKLPNGGATIATAMGGTGVIFLALSAYVLTTKKDFSFIGGLFGVAFMVVIIGAVANLFLQIPMFSVLISSAIIVLMSGFILYDTSRIIHGGETNYIRATVSMFLNILNLFTSLLHLLGMGDD